MGLRGRMAASYVLVTAAVVIVVEAVLLGVYLPSVIGGTELERRLQSQAGRDAKILSLIVSKVVGELSGPDAMTLLTIASENAGAELSLRGTPAGYTEGVQIRSAQEDVFGEPVEVLLDDEGVVVTSSARSVYASGQRMRIPAAATGRGTTPAGEALWAVSPVLLRPPGGKGAGDGSSGELKTWGEKPADGLSEKLKTVGYVMVQAPPGSGTPVRADLLPGLILPGAAVLVLGVPVGLLFGLLGTRRLIGRMRRLAVVAGTVAGGDFRHRVPVTRRDEVGRLEESFNAMTGRLEEALAAQRAAAQGEARQAERARIARELHDSISQDLFSLSLLAAGMRRAAPEHLRREAEAMERTSARAMREMQALLLELRPVALEDAGLVPAVEELCRAYETRLGIRVETVLEEVTLAPATEHAVLRLIQEALGNAVKHGDPGLLRVRLARSGPAVRVEISDDGAGFDPETVNGRHGMGLRLMRERVCELGGAFELRSAPGRGTTVTVVVP
ncbi:HAMP domain-containing sensor histidine kinase [Planobispora takensis]|uniref:Oxygen sensor histidine kinase NreB n=1 Tax=Planobispora takensis TaxID=1367882 RepID=A0A8J3T3J1_9ACTN|nr:sensor histidine kinase [Planobispora takensis]GII03390.1 hypothetical protein Pta02_53980 [Planobispora takensis]